MNDLTAKFDESKLTQALEGPHDPSKDVQSLTAGHDTPATSQPKAKKPKAKKPKAKGKK